MKYFDWDSCDSTTYINGMKFGEVFELSGEIKKIKPPLAVKLYPNFDYKDRVIHNAKIMLQYIDKINTLKGKAVVSPKPTV